MSYVVSVVRESPIEEAELEKIAVEAGDFELEVMDGFSILHWLDAESNARESFVLSDGSLDITTPSDAALMAAQELAERLGAKVIGEEGEDLTEVEVSGNVTVSSGCNPVAGSIFLMGVLLALFWLLA